MAKKNTCYLIVESPLHGEPVLLAVTPGSMNEKTGDMAQIYILHPDNNPLEISKQGLDDLVCGSCPLRHSLGGACYVVLFMGPNNVYRAWENQGKKVDDVEDFLALCHNKRVRFGAYGDPSHIPAWLVSEIMSASKGWTAYTHAWRNPKVASTWKGKAMASCDTVAQLRLAESKGWAGFLVSPEPLDINVCDNEISGTQCTDCMRCDGSNGSVIITPHGTRSKRHPSMKHKR